MPEEAIALLTESFERNRPHLEAVEYRMLAAGAIGLLIGFAAPVLGELAATGLVLYFTCVLGAHIRARDTGFGGAVSLLALAAGSLVANLAYDHGW